MKTNTIELQINKAIKIHFGNDYVNNSLSQDESSNKEVKKVNDNEKLFFALGALAIVVIGGLSYKKFHSIKRLKESGLNNSNAAIQTTSFLHNIMEIFSKKMSKSEFLKFDDEFKRLRFPKYGVIDFLKNDDAKNFVKYILAAKNSGLSNFIELPKVLILNNINTRIKDIGKILVTALESNFVSTKYTKGHIAEFIESLDEFSSNALKKYNEEQTHTFLHFDNVSEFLTDLKLKENEQFKERFDKIIDKNHENKIVYILDDKAVTPLNKDSILKLEFDEKINTVDLTKDLDEVEFQLGHKLLSKVENVNKELFEYIQPDQQSVFLIKNLLMDNLTQKVFITNSTDKSVVDKAITLIASKTNNVFEKLDCKETSNLVDILSQKGERAEDLYQRTGKRTFLYLDNLEHTPQINDFIITANEKYHTIPVLNAQNKEIISKLNLPENQIIKMDFWAKGQKAIVDSLELMNERATKNDFSHIDLERLKREFFTWIAAERSGKDPKISNGILLYGSDNLTSITADAIKNTVDANYIKLNYDKNELKKLIIELVEEAEKAEKLFKQTRKRTIIEADGLDNILTLDTETRENLSLINAFKNIAENLSENYHTTLIMRTDKPLEQFEAASIASNRLGMHIEVK